MDTPDWFKPGVRVRLKDGLLLDYPREAVLEPSPDAYSGLLYPRGDGYGAVVLPLHVEPLDVPGEVAQEAPRKVRFREFL